MTEKWCVSLGRVALSVVISLLCLCILNRRGHIRKTQAQTLWIINCTRKSHWCTILCTQSDALFYPLTLLEEIK